MTSTQQTHGAIDKDMALESYKTTGLWKRSLGNEMDLRHRDAYVQLNGAFATFRERAGALTSQIAKALPNLTIHDLTHLDALWETADLIAGNAYRLNPAEAFVLGGAILLHDSALCFEAYKGGQAGLRATIEWRDALAGIEARNSAASLDEKQDEADFAAMRHLHAAQAGVLALKNWATPEGEALYLIESHELRKHYGQLIGDIASSHHWSIEDVEFKLQSQLNAPGTFPRDWRVDPVKIACLLRCADAAHLDSRRAPDFLRALAKLHGVSARHWTAQNWLERADRDTADPKGDAIIFTSGKPFDENNAEAWWVAYDAIQVVDSELLSSAALLERRPQVTISPPFQMRRVTGADSPLAASRTIKTRGWVPRAVEIHVSNLERLISELGGNKLYGGEQSLLIVLREMIQNARDAVVARCAIDPTYKGRIRIKHETDGDRHTLIVEDDGIGMSERIITGPLLDFGASFWASDLASREFPGLLSSGYRSVGKFGIGFYSIFMVASAASITSRRFDAGQDTVVQVKFPNGLSLRPLVAVGAPDGFGYDNCTRVTIKLKPEFGNPEAIVIRKGRPGYEAETKLPLGQCLAILCAGLDVHVELSDKTGVLSIVHRPLSKLNTVAKRRDWLFDLAAPDKKTSGDEVLDAHAERLRPIVKNGRALGMAALSVTSNQTHTALGTVKTVGGLANAIQLTDLSTFIGSIDYEPRSAKRDPGQEIAAGHTALAKWAAEQIGLLPDRAIDPVAWCFATASLANLEIDPIDIATFLIRDKDGLKALNLDQVVDLILVSGLAFYQSSMMSHVEVYHSLGAFHGMPTFWPVTNSGLLSLERDANGEARITSALSCIERRAKSRGANVVSNYATETVRGHFGQLQVLLLSAQSKS